MMTDLPRQRLQNGGDLRSLKFGNLILYEPGCISTKPKIPCSPGLTPVIIDDHATDEISGIEDRIGAKNPFRIIWPILGITSACASSLSKDTGTPSRPMMISRFGRMLFFVADNPARTNCCIFNEDESSEFFYIVE